MTERQRRFAEHFAASGNATAAAKAAGYSEKTAYSQGGRLLKNDEVIRYVRDLQEKNASNRILSIARVQEFWSDTVLDETIPLRDRLRASELLGRAGGAFANSHRADDDGGFGGTNDTHEDVIIMLPKISDEKGEGDEVVGDWVVIR